MRRHRHRATLWASVGLAVGAIGACRTAAGDGWEGSLAATTDYVFRGLTQTGNAAAIQADLHYRTASGGFAGAWASSIDPAEDYVGKLELNAYAGWMFTPAADWSARLSYVRYLYPDTTSGYNYDYGEIMGSVAYDGRAFATVAWSPDMVRYSAAGVTRRGSASSVEVSFRQPVWRDLALAGGLGYYDLSHLFGAGYLAWSATLAYPVDRVEFDLSLFGTDSTAQRLFDGQAEVDRWVVTAIWRF